MREKVKGYKSLKALRQEAGFKRAKDAAQALDISLSMLQKIETGDRQPSIRLVQKISSVYKCSIEQIFSILSCTISEQNSKM